ncbi:hypothetical protein [Dietzia cercidiphylli]|uniref:hypothetical protein n=1 Tax=Dietzia cercidiphylli TaxID=498199 RepID=UPI00223B0FB0|nr:hypothetical protein [Dietzia cercidiphylli]MCT1515292.1 hypothetical protein [Dietzia cercidiphylli]
MPMTYRYGAAACAAALAILAGCTTSTDAESGSAEGPVTTTTTATTTLPGEAIPAAPTPVMFQARDYWPEIEAAAAQCAPVLTPDRLDRYIWAVSRWTVDPSAPTGAGADEPSSTTPTAAGAPTDGPISPAAGEGLAQMPAADWAVYGDGGDPNDPHAAIAAVGRQVCDIQKRLADIAAHDELRVHGRVPELAAGEDPELTVATYSAIERGLNNVLGGMGADADSEFVRKVLYLR